MKQFFSFLDRSVFLFMDNNSNFREELSNTLRILVATDCHLGYMEKDEIRRHDSFQAFEEICSIASQKKVLISLLSFIDNRSYVIPLCHCQ